MRSLFVFILGLGISMPALAAKQVLCFLDNDGNTGKFQLKLRTFPGQSGILLQLQTYKNGGTISKFMKGKDCDFNDPKDAIKLDCKATNSEEISLKRVKISGSDTVVEFRFRSRDIVGGVIQAYTKPKNCSIK